MSCDAFLPQVAAKAVGTLDEPGAIDAHLQACRACAGLLEEMEAELDRGRLPEEEPAPGGWDRVLLRLDGRTEAAPPPVVRLHCSYCRDDLRRAEAAHCAACLAPHHPDCFEEHGRCAAPGCGETRTLAPSRSSPVRRPGWRGGVVLAIGLVAGGAGAVAAWNVRDQAAARDRELAWVDRERERMERELEIERARASSHAHAEPTYDGKPLSHWIEVLGDHGDVYRETGSKAVHAIGAPAVPALLRALASESPIRRRAAARTLGKIGSPVKGQPRVAPKLMALLADADPAMRRVAAEVLPLCAAEEERAAAALALAALLDRTELPEPRERDSIYEGLIGLRDRPEARAVLIRAAAGEPEPLQRRDIWRALISRRPPEPEVVEAFLHAIPHDPQQVVREDLVGYLGALQLDAPQWRRTAEALGVLLQREPEHDIREAALKRIAMLAFEAQRGAAPALVALIRNECSQPRSEQERRRAYEILSRLMPVEERDVDGLLAGAALVVDPTQPPEVVARILTAVVGREPGVQRQALRFVHTRGASDTLTPLLVALALQSPELEVRLLAAERALGSCCYSPPELLATTRIALAPVVPDLAAALGQPELVGRALALAEQLGPAAAPAVPAVHELLAAESTSLQARSQALSALASVAPADSLTLTAALLAIESERSETISAGAQVLRRLEQHTPALRAEVGGRVAARLFARPALAEGDLRRELLRTLVHLGPDAAPAGQVWSELIRLAASDVDDECRELARRFLKDVKERKGN